MTYLTNSDLLFHGLCVIRFELEDHSIIESITTLNQELLARYGVSHLDGFIDLDIRKVIPAEYFDYLVEIRSGTEKRLSTLDKMFEQGAKVHWQ